MGCWGGQDNLLRMVRWHCPIICSYYIFNYDTNPRLSYFFKQILCKVAGLAHGWSTLKPPSYRKTFPPPSQSFVSLPRYTTLTSLSVEKYSNLHNFNKNICLAFFQIYCSFSFKLMSFGTQQTRDIEPMLGHCWLTMYDAGSPLAQCLVSAGKTNTCKTDKTGYRGD